jgi:pyruvate dehydrogenase E1 component alpha subunit
VGQEAIAVGVCANLRPTDYIASYHRGHGHAIAKGADIGKMMRELLGREGGTCGGKGGSMHIADFSVGMLGANGVVADGVTIAVGAAQAVKLLREDRVVVAFFGDGAVNRGPLLEAFNWAVIYKLPVLFVCEDNQYAATVRTAEFTGGDGIIARAQSFGIPAESIDGNDVSLVFDTTKKVLEAVRHGRPALIHALAYRWYGHFAHDAGAYRDPEAHRKALELDPLSRCRAMLLRNGVPDKALDEARKEVESRVARALAEAEAAPLPAAQEAFRDIQDLDAAWK